MAPDRTLREPFLYKSSLYSLRMDWSDWVAVIALVAAVGSAIFTGVQAHAARNSYLIQRDEAGRQKYKLGLRLKDGKLRLSNHGLQRVYVWDIVLSRGPMSYRHNMLNTELEPGTHEELVIFDNHWEPRTNDEAVIRWGVSWGRRDRETKVVLDSVD